MAASDISRRAKQLVEGAPMPTYIVEHMARSGASNPNDPAPYVGLCVAQNLLMWDILEEKVNRDRHVPPTAVAYGDHLGSLDLRQAIADFGSANIWGRDVSPSNLAVLAGAGAILETLFHSIADEGDGVLVPTPSYAFYWNDLETRDGLSLIPVHTSPHDGFRLTPDLLQTASDAAEIPVAALLLTNPDNPTGRIMPAEDLTACIEWAQNRGIHVVVNGIYSQAVHSDSTFQPVSSLVGETAAGVHEIWGFSKDFAMSGVRAGVLMTESADVIAAVSEVSHWSVVSGDTQHLLVSMLGDAEWTDRYLSEMRSRLRVSYEATTGALAKAGIPFVPSDAGLFLLADFRAFLDDDSWEAEDLLWRRILDETNVNITPGSACRISEPGFMRICFATETPDNVATAIGRVGTVLSANR